MIDLLNEFSEEELKFINVNFLPGIKKKQWIKERGSRVYQPYVDINNPSFEVVKEIYSYEYKSGLREIKNYSRSLKYHSPNGEVILEIDTTPDITDDHISEVNKYCRNWRMDYLERAAKNLLDLANTLSELNEDGSPNLYRAHYIIVGSAIEELLEHYADQIFKYRNRNFLSMELETSVIAETDAHFIDLLNKWAKPPGTDANFPNGLKVIDSILYQLTGIVS